MTHPITAIVVTDAKLSMGTVYLSTVPTDHAGRSKIKLMTDTWDASKTSSFVLAFACLSKIRREICGKARYNASINNAYK